MPARRDILTGRLNFLERGWGGIEPFDACFTETLANGVFTHLVTDHYHYVQVGGENYHCTYNTWTCTGQESDKGSLQVEKCARASPHLGMWRE